MSKQKKIIIKDKKINSLFYSFGFKIKIYFIFLLIMSIYTFLADIINDIKKNGSLTKIYFYFTNQMVFSVLIILFSFFLKIKNQKRYSIFIFATAVNAFLTFLVFNLFLYPFWTERNILLQFWKDLKPNKITWIEIFLNKYIISILEHIFLPLFYFFLFFFFIRLSLEKFQKIFYTFLHPFIYLFIYFLIIIFCGGDCGKLIKNGHTCGLPYPNIQCPKHGQVFFKQDYYPLYLQFILVFIRIISLTFLFSLIFIILFYLKKRFIK